MTNPHDQNENYDETFSEDFEEIHEEGYDESAVTDEDDSSDWDQDQGENLQDEPPEEAAQKPKKKKSNLLIGVVLAVVILGGLAVVGLGGSGNQAPQPVEEVKPIVAEEDDSSAPAPSNETLNQAPATEKSAEVAPNQGGAQPEPMAETSGGLMNSPEVIEGQAQPVGGPVLAPAPVVEAGNGTMTAPEQNPAPIQTGSEQVAPAKVEEAVSLAAGTISGAIQNEVKPVSDFPTVDAIKKDVDPVPATTLPINDGAVEADIPTVPETTAPVAETIAAPEPKNAEPSAEIEALKAQLSQSEEKIADLQKSVEQKDEQLRQVASQPTGDDNSQELADLKEKIQQLESLLEKKSESSDLAAEPSSPKEAQSKAKPVKVSAPKEPAKVSNGAKPKEPPQKDEWQLVGAVQGRAILQNKQSGERRTVSVGEKVSSLGVIKAISKTSTGWVVQGSQMIVGE